MTLLGLALLVGLGHWQLERKAWKEDLIATIAQRTKEEPVELLTAYSATYPSNLGFEYTRVKARGRFHHDKERYYYAPDPELGPGYDVYTPFRLAGDGPAIFVNRGFVSEALKDPAKRPPGQIDGEVEVVGLLRTPGAKGFFTPDNDAERNLWYWPDFDGMLGSAFGGDRPPAIPVLLEAEAPAPGGWPKGGATRIDLPNRHLEYAITWFGLAAALACVFAVYAWPRLRAATN
jgi:surfeit locus 1 family protein